MPFRLVEGEMSRDSDSSESPTAKWLTQDRRGDRGRIAEEENKTKRKT